MPTRSNPCFDSLLRREVNDASAPRCIAPAASEAHDELALLVDAGLTPTAALQAATINAARVFGWSERIGSVARGKLADLVLLADDPLADIRNTTKIRAVVANGRVLTREALDSMLVARR